MWTYSGFPLPPSAQRLVYQYIRPHVYYQFVTGAYSYNGDVIYVIDANQNVYHRNTSGTWPFSLTSKESNPSGYPAWKYDVSLLPACVTVPVMESMVAPVLYCSMNDVMGTMQLIVVTKDGGRRRLPYRRPNAMTVGLFYDWKGHEMMWSFSFTYPHTGRNAYIVRLGPTMQVTGLASHPLNPSSNLRFASNISAASAAIYPSSYANRKLYILSQSSQYSTSGHSGAYNIIELPTDRSNNWDTPPVILGIPPIRTTW